MFKRIVLTLAVLVASLLGYAATKPDTYRVHRTLTMAAPAAVIFGQLEDFKAWGHWSPWDKLDPKMTKTFEGPEKGKGASFSWRGNDKVGKGKMTIVGSEPPTSITYSLEFIEPFVAQATTRFELAPPADANTDVTWSMQGINSFAGKVFSVFMDMDKTIGRDFEIGLAGLKGLAEEAAKKAAAEGKAAAEAKAATEKSVAETAAAVAKAAAEADAAAESAESVKKRKRASKP
jgi:hypothetical protein